MGANVGARLEWTSCVAKCVGYCFRCCLLLLHSSSFFERFVFAFRFRHRHLPVHCFVVSCVVRALYKFTVGSRRAYTYQEWQDVSISTCESGGGSGKGARMVLFGWAPRGVDDGFSVDGFGIGPLCFYFYMIMLLSIMLSKFTIWSAIIRIMLPMLPIMLA